MTGRYLLDTHVFLTMADPSRKLAAPAVAALGAATSEVFLSVVSLAECCIKASLGKLDLPKEIEADPLVGFRTSCERAGMTMLPIVAEHACRLRFLPRHHGDPFDRLLIAQAMEENLVLVSADRAFAAYDGLALLRP
jgi:PIN domain nuclease of toxin-antitoxin system